MSRANVISEARAMAEADRSTLEATKNAAERDEAVRRLMHRTKRNVRECRDSAIRNLFANGDLTIQTYNDAVRAIATELCRVK